jgi:hypothetical protein
VPQCTLSGPCGENGENGSGFSNESSISVGYVETEAVKSSLRHAMPHFGSNMEQQKSSERCADGMVCLLGIMIALKQSKIRHSRGFSIQKLLTFQII